MSALCLRAMSEVGLVALELADGCMFSVRALEREGKADLTSSPLMIKLRSRRDEFRERRRRHD